MKISEMPVEKVVVGVEVRSLIDDGNGRITSIDEDDDRTSWITWDWHQEPASCFYGNSCDCEVVYYKLVDFRDRDQMVNILARISEAFPAVKTLPAEYIPGQARIAAIESEWKSMAAPYGLLDRAGVTVYENNPVFRAAVEV